MALWTDGDGAGGDDDARPCEVKEAKLAAASVGAKGDCREGRTAGWRGGADDRAAAALGSGDDTNGAPCIRLRSTTC